MTVKTNASGALPLIEGQVVIGSSVPAFSGAVAHITVEDVSEQDDPSGTLDIANCECL